MEEAHHLLPVLILLVVGILAIGVMRPLKMSPIVGYLIAGMLIGGYGFGWIEESDTTRLLAELGVVFLLFDIGLHFSVGHIWDARRDIFGLGPIQIILCTGAFTLIALFMGLSAEFAIIIGATLALSSTAVVAQILAENKQNQCPVAVSTTAVLIFQDVCAIFLLILAGSMGDSEVSLGSIISIAAIKAVLAFAAAILIGRFVIGPVFNFIAQSKDHEVFTATALLIVLATAAATALFGLSMTLGAFLAGMIISETPYRHVVQTEVKPFRGLLLGFFFITVGMTLDVQVILHEGWKILSVALVLVTIKSILIFIAARALKIESRSALQMGVLLSQGSEFAFVIFAIPSIQEALGKEYSSILIIAVAASMAFTPVLVNMAQKLARKWADQDWNKSRNGNEVSESLEASVIVVGMSEVGRRLASALDANNITYRAVEMDHDCFVDACTNGYKVGFGDATDLRLMDTIKMAHAKTVAITFADYDVSSQLAPIVMERHPELTLIVSVKNEADKVRFNALGMQAVLQHSFPRGLDMAVAVLEASGVDKKKQHNWMKRQQIQELDDVFAPQVRS
ncbi:MAG: cation:proton antiporter [Cocleimonas sp.]|nr:cation:proton antiporter [Cocleimonas sp.]